MKENDKDNIENGNSSENSTEKKDIFNEVKTDYSKYLESDEDAVEEVVKQEKQQDIKNKEIKVAKNKSKDKNSKKDKSPKKEEKAKDKTNNSNNEEIQSDNQEPKKKNWWERQIEFWKSEGHVGKKVLRIFLTLLVIAIIVGGGYLLSRLGLINTNDDQKKPKVTAHDKIYGDIDFEMMDDITDAKSLNDMLKKWATNGGAKMSSKNVINFLLIGVDSQSDLSDSMMIMSLDKKNKQIKLCSIYRDSYTYIDAGKKEHFAKLNAAFAYGGPKVLVNTIENDYKVKIDDYVYVNYDTFPKIIDALGGLKLKLTSKEANHLNHEYGYSLRSGTQTLNGGQVLMYSRIRHLDADGDISRTKRQRYVITTLINNCKNASVSKCDKLIKALFPYLSTSLSKTEILSLATQAISKDWVRFEVVQNALPSLDFAKGGHIGDQWVWIVDYPGAAHELQMYIYGYSNIKLKENRKTALDLKPTTKKSSSNSTTKKKSSSSNTRKKTSSSDKKVNSKNPISDDTNNVPKNDTQNSSNNNDDSKKTEKQEKPVNPDSKPEEELKTPAS